MQNLAQHSVRSQISLVLMRRFRTRGRSENPKKWANWRISDFLCDNYIPQCLAFTAIPLAQTNYGVLWGKEKYHVAVSPRRLGRCLGMSPPLPRRGLCSVLDLPECHPQDDHVALFQTRPLVRLGAGALHSTDLDCRTHARDDKADAAS